PDNPDRKYGFTCFAWVPLSSFVTASDMKIADKDPATGENAYAKTLEEHNENVALYKDLWDAAQ
ncbi:MAG: hypothetical protein IJB22_05625, partial [Clostridia bacterium]|nr:hypothetical protein [Clostridia bacterium]